MSKGHYGQQGIEEWWKHSIEKKVLSILGPTGLIPETPHDMREIMKYTQEQFVNLELNSEIAVSSGSAAVAMEAGYSYIVNKLNIFMVNVLRFKGEGDLSGLVDGAG